MMLKATLSKKTSRTSIGYTTIQVIISFLGVVYVVYRFKIDNIYASANFLGLVLWPQMVACLASVFLLYLVRMIRLRLWVHELRPGYSPRRGWLLLYFKSVAFGAVTPARLGDFSRISLLGDSGLDRMTRARVVLMDKMADSIYVPIAFLWTAEFVGSYFGVNSLLLGALGIVCLAIYACLLWVLNTIGTVKLLQGISLTCLGFLLFTASNIYLFRAVGLTLASDVIIAITVTIGALVSLPVSIAGIGVREAGLLNMMTLLGCPQDMIFAVIFWEFFVNIIFPLCVLATLFCLAKCQLFQGGNDG